ncbi:MAG: tRNA (5-methylaminomethyl-2-thiouridine)(34)-methyltransferase MnmD [Pseudomonadales bacterium]
MSNLACGLPMQSAELIWQDQQPFATAFNDIYHAKDGAAESNRVFIEPAAIPNRWQQQADFTVAEIGFGTGLNLVALLERWQRAPGTRLHYIAFEQFPLSENDWAKVCSTRSALHSPYALLQQRYPPAVSGWHQRSLGNGSVMLSLYWGDAAAGLADLHDRLALPVDAWWLDGFAPDRNPQLWTAALFAQLADLSAAGASVTTFTAAGRVRRRLAAVGFSMRRVDQRPHKRESLAGNLDPAHQARGLCRDPSRAQTRKLARSMPIQIVGAGVAGASLARGLAEAGCQIQVFDAGHAPVGASALPAAVLHSRLLSDGSPSAALRIHGQLYASARLKDWPQWQPSGVLQCASNPAQAQKLERISEQFTSTGDWCQPLTASETKQHTANWINGVQGPGLWFADSGALAPEVLIRWLLNHSNIDVRWQQPLADERAWEGIRIYANGTGIFSIAAARFLELSQLGGQLEIVAATTPTTPLVGAGYVVPTTVQNSSQMLLGGNYEYQPWSPQHATAHNLAKVQQPLRWLGRVRAVRVTSSDRIPVAGALLDSAQQRIGNRLVSVGHGSLGMTSSHLCAALLSSQLRGSAPPVTRELEQALAPARFRQRQARRGYRFGASN